MSERYAAWQEAEVQKNIERALGVLQPKLQILFKNFEYWCVNDIQNILETKGIILHNMMVQNRIEKDEEEDDCWYSGDLLSREKTNDLPVEDPTIKEATGRHKDKNELLGQLKELLCRSRR
jgi:hypothetical protein